eukprot:CAMPEP_0170774670 /NCGR_PEP_ID=MMETSP0733-20121128/10093_1 /TAXON_ID=186038 /ORGANISM="Fragilariopsis kerguelensis, Strain L26-C5" /LENGTH=316 /DNA_ID=CAMNT_0011117265 /DNA_START=602 /DNA_END=1549 /DNA_ORIENTATION=+
MTTRSSFKRKANTNAESIIDGLHNMKRSVLEAVVAATLRSSPTAVLAAEKVLQRKNKKAKKEEFSIGHYLYEADDDNYSIDREYGPSQYRDAFGNCKMTGDSLCGCAIPCKLVNPFHVPEKQEHSTYRDRLLDKTCLASNDKDDNVYDWSAFRDDSNQIYYHNNKTKETSWEPPANNEPFNLIVPEEEDGDDDDDEDKATKTNDANTIETLAADCAAPAFWFMDRVCVRLRSDNRSAVVMKINPDKTALVELEDHTSKTVGFNEVSRIQPQEKDMVLVIGGADVGVEGELICIDGSDAILKDSNEDFKIVDFVHLA